MQRSVLMHSFYDVIRFDRRLPVSVSLCAQTSRFTPPHFCDFEFYQCGYSTRQCFFCSTAVQSRDGVELGPSPTARQGFSQPESAQVRFFRAYFIRKVWLAQRWEMKETAIGCF